MPSYDLLEPGYRAWLGLFAVALAAVHFFAGRELQASGEPSRVRAGTMYAGVAFAFFTLAMPIQLPGYRVTMAWALEAAALAWIAARTRNDLLLKASACVFGLALIRLAAVDAQPPEHFRPGDQRLLQPDRPRPGREGRAEDPHLGIRR